MYSPRKKCKTPSVDDFQFPYVPYTIQQNLMESLYEVIENKEIGIFESPTGTGKSLTLTCGALRWLEDREALISRDLQQHISDIRNQITRATHEQANDTNTDWISAQYSVRLEKDKLGELQKLNQLLEKYQEQLNDLKTRVEQSLLKEHINTKKRENAAIVEELVENEDADVEDATGEETDEERFHMPKIFFCSRTHSQLGQVMREVKRTAYGRRIRCISLASRQQLCINPEVKRLPAAQLNERCLDMARSTKAQSDTISLEKKAKTLSKCPFKGQAQIHQLHDVMLHEIHDIEELVNKAERYKACPYYSARAAIEMAQMVMLPYQLLLHRRTRTQSGINLRGAVVIIDEAHNLLDTIHQLHSHTISLEQLSLAQKQIQCYKMRFVNRFTAANLLRINQLLFVVKRLVRLLQPAAGQPERPSGTRFLRSYELMAEGEFFNIDLFQLLEFSERNRLAQKLQHIIIDDEPDPIPKENVSPNVSATVALLRKMEEQHKKGKQRKTTVSEKVMPEVATNGNAKPTTGSPPSAIRPLLAFIEALTDNAEDGRILVHISEAADPAQSYLKYVLLNASDHIKEILEEVRAVIIAGGTMQPTAELTQQLFGRCRSRVKEFFYGHVVPADAVLPLIIARGPTGQQMLFNYSQRGGNQMLSELGMIFQNICNVVPDGIVCFLPSYDFLDTVYGHLERSGVLARMSQKKTIFREMRSSGNGQTIDQLLTNYAGAIRRGNGGFLFSVVGGKLSEGLNFADELGRGVIVVGMPYPNRQAEILERMNNLDATLGAGAGAEYYENLCMKAINQCIGRSVRHINDYACVFLLDHRYTNANIQKKLPQWITRSLQSPATFGAAQMATAKFFKQKHAK